MPFPLITGRGSRPAEGCDATAVYGFFAARAGLHKRRRMCYNASVCAGIAAWAGGSAGGPMNKKSLVLVIFAYVLWGVLPFYWHLLDSVDAIVILCCRILFAAVFTTLMLACMGRFGEIKAVFRNKRLMSILLPAGVVVSVNWGLYIYAVNAGHVMDASLGYYMNPLVIFACGMLVFRERCNRLEIAAVVLAAVGVVITTASFGAFPFLAVSMAVTFAIYGILKKFAHVDGFVSIAVETLLVSPAALAYLLCMPAARGAIAHAPLSILLLLMLAGPVTATPLALYTRAVNDLPMVTVGFLQYILPTMLLVVGVAFNGEAFTLGKAISFGFIWAGLILFSIGMLQKERKMRQEKPAAAETPGKA